MRAIIDFDMTDQQRELITQYYRKVLGEKGLPKLATRSMIRDFVEAAVETQWLHVTDSLNGKDE